MYFILYLQLSLEISFKKLMNTNWFWISTFFFFFQTIEIVCCMYVNAFTSIIWNYFVVVVVFLLVQCDRHNIKRLDGWTKGRRYTHTEAVGNFSSHICHTLNAMKFCLSPLLIINLCVKTGFSSFQCFLPVNNSLNTLFSHKSGLGPSLRFCFIHTINTQPFSGFSSTSFGLFMWCFIFWHIYACVNFQMFLLMLCMSLRKRDISCVFFFIIYL